MRKWTSFLIASYIIISKEKVIIKNVYIHFAVKLQECMRLTKLQALHDFNIISKLKASRILSMLKNLKNVKI